MIRSACRALDSGFVKNLNVLKFENKNSSLKVLELVLLCASNKMVIDYRKDLLISFLKCCRT